MAERLFHHDPAPAPAVLELRITDTFDRRLVVAGLRGKIEKDVVLRMARLLHFIKAGAELCVGVRIVQVAGEIKQVLREVAPQPFVERRILDKFVQGFFHLFAKRVIAHAGARVTDDGETRREAPVIGKPVKSGNQFTLGKITVCAEYNDGARRYATLKPQRVLERICLGHSLPQDSIGLGPIRVVSIS